MKNIIKWIIIVLLFIDLTYSQAISKNQSNLAEIVRNDLVELKKNVKSNFLNEKEDDYFIKLFLEGIIKSNNFLEKINKPKRIDNYLKFINSAYSYIDSLDIGHSKNNYNQFNKCSLSIFEKAEINVFRRFMGKWSGYWKKYYVEQYWLKPKKVNIPLKAYTIELIQTVYIGDGIGWNYVISIGDKYYVLGFSCHLNSKGKVNLKRPHIGFLHQTNGLVWLTEDHLYFEFICRNKAHINIPPHYVINGMSYVKNGKNFFINDQFSTTYISGYTLKLKSNKTHSENEWGDIYSLNEFFNTKN